MEEIERNSEENENEKEGGESYTIYNQSLHRQSNPIATSQSKAVVST
jgi:hypothetical protein